VRVPSSSERVLDEPPSARSPALHADSRTRLFKPQLPRFFHYRLTEPGAVVYDRFAARHELSLEAGLAGRVPFACDIQPAQRDVLEPRLSPPAIDDVRRRLESLDLGRVPGAARPGGVLSQDTLNEIAAACGLLPVPPDRQVDAWTLDSGWWR